MFPNPIAPTRPDSYRFDIYLNVVNEAFIFDNTNGDHLLLAEINNTTKLEIIKNTNFELLKSYYDTARNA